MRFLSMFLFAAIASLPAAPLPKQVSKQATTGYPATYAGGSLPLNHQKLQTTLGNDEVVFMQGSQRIAVPVKEITQISCGTEVSRRLGATVLDVVPMMHLGESETHYIGVTWTGAAVLLKLSRAEYRDFLSALEHATGIKAIDTNRTPTIVRYAI